jgi:hypothetical protein
MVTTQGCVPDERSHIHGRRSGNECADVPGEGEIPELGGLTKQVDGIWRLAGQSRGRTADSAVAYDYGRHTLRQLGEHTWGTQHVKVVVGMGIDETGGQHAPFNIKNLLGGVARQISNCGYESSSDCDVAGLRLDAAAIKDPRSADQGIALVQPRPPGGYESALFPRSITP